MSVTQTGRRSLFKLASTPAAAVLSLFLTTRGIQPAWAQATETDSAVQSVVQGVRDPFGMPVAPPNGTVVQVAGDHGLRADRAAVAAAVREWLEARLSALPR